MDTEHFDNRPIGVFDSGYGGLTVARALQKRLPEESILYFGDSARCPYGPRDQAEVDGFVQQICTWLVGRDVKMIVIACNTATAAGLAHAQENFSVPVVGVVEPGARAAAHTTLNRRVGVIATKGTVDSNAYSDAIRHIDAGITVFSTATPRFVEIAEMGLKLSDGPIEDYMADTTKVYIRPEFEDIARQYLEPLRRCDIDTLVLGCTHYPLLKALIGGVVGRKVTLVNSAAAPTPARATCPSTRFSPRPTTWRSSGASAAACSPAPWTSSRTWICPHCKQPPAPARCPSARRSP